MKKTILFLLLFAFAVNSYSQLIRDSLVQYTVSREGDSVRNFKQEYSNYYGTDWQNNISYLWNKDKSEWVPTQKTEYTYVEDGIWTDRYRYRWDTLVSDWVPNDHYFREWTDFGFVSNNLLRTWSIESGQWVDSWKQENSFFDENTRVSQISHNWDIELNEWIPERITDYEFTGDFDILSYIQYLWSVDDGRWNLYRKGEFDYDSNENRTDSRYWNWDSETGVWENSSKYHYAYDAWENMILYEYHAWNSEDDTWEFRSKTLREYEENSSRKVLEEYYNADSDSIPLYRYIYGFDNDGRMISQQNQRRDSDGVTMINSNLDLTSFQSDGTVLIKKKHYWNKGSEEWTHFVTEVSYYSVILGINHFETESINIYPNPTSGLINISGLNNPFDLEIYTIQGQLVKSEYRVEGILDVSELKPGLYLLKLDTGVESIVKRIVIE